jgi:hypothetical protein
MELAVPSERTYFRGWYVMSRSLCALSGAFRRIFGVALLALAFVVLSTPARAAQDVVHFGSSIDVGANEEIHDAVCFFCSVNVQGTVNGNIVSFFGSVRISGHAEHDVVDFFGDVKVSDDSSIGHDLVNFFGSVWLGENASVDRDAVVMFGSMHSAPSASFGGNRVVEPGWIFWGPFLLIFAGIYFVVHEIQGYRRRRFLRMY